MLDVKNLFTKILVELPQKADISILSSVATSGDYDDLSNKPSIPTATSDLTNDSGYITSSDIPTNVSDFTNDSGYITSSAIPTNVSAFSNDAAYLDKAGVLNLFYPVGSYYETSDTSFNPNNTWGGTWVLETAGQVHVSAGTGYAVSGALTNASDGGSKYLQAHTHSDNFTLPNHVHGSGGTASTDTDMFLVGSSASDGGIARRAIKNGTGTSLAGNYYNAEHAITRKQNTGNPTTNPSINGSVGAVSGATTGNEGNMPPYIVVNRWHRTA